MNEAGRLIFVLFTISDKVYNLGYMDNFSVKFEILISVTQKKTSNYSLLSCLCDRSNVQRNKHAFRDRGWADLRYGAPPSCLIPPLLIANLIQ